MIGKDGKIIAFFPSEVTPESRQLPDRNHPGAKPVSRKSESMD